jgi:hypothetical protein
VEINFCDFLEEEDEQFEEELNQYNTSAGDNQKQNDQCINEQRIISYSALHNGIYQNQDI